jgi:hypothetical protein
MRVAVPWAVPCAAPDPSGAGPAGTEPDCAGGASWASSLITSSEIVSAAAFSGNSNHWASQEHI